MLIDAAMANPVNLVRIGEGRQGEISDRRWQEVIEINMGKWLVGLVGGR
jgi:hypothetical protein